MFAEPRTHDIYSYSSRVLVTGTAASDQVCAAVGTSVSGRPVRSRAGGAKIWSVCPRLYIVSSGGSTNGDGGSEVSPIIDPVSLVDGHVWVEIWGHHAQQTTYAGLVAGGRRLVMPGPISPVGCPLVVNASVAPSEIIHVTAHWSNYTAGVINNIALGWVCVTLQVSTEP